MAEICVNRSCGLLDFRFIIIFQFIVNLLTSTFKLKTEIQNEFFRYGILNSKGLENWGFQSKNKAN